MTELQNRARRDATCHADVRAQPSLQLVRSHLAQKLAGVALAALLLGAVDARAAGGNGGTGQGLIALFGNGSGGYGALGGINSFSNNFGSAGGLVCSSGSGGGGGGGAGDGMGGPGGGPGNGTPAGQAGSDNQGCFGGSGGGGGTGGAHGQIGSGWITVASPVAGSSGGTGGAGGQVNFIFNPGAGPGAAGNGGGGGGGGEGGYGVYMDGTGARTLDNYGTISGGSGGTGGNAGSAIIPMFIPGITGSGGGNGGDGGIGIFFAPGATSNTLANYGTVQGGSGGLGGSGGVLSGAVTGYKGTTGNAGLGGVGVVGFDLTVVNGGSISGGLSGDGATRANAINFFGSSRLTTLAGGTLTGDIGIGYGVLTLLQTGASAGYANIIKGDGALAITTAGSNVITLSGANTYGGGTTVTAGSTLWLGNSQAIGSGALALQSGTALQLIASGMSFANATSVTGNASIGVDSVGTWSGAIADGASAGGLVKTGQGRLILSGANTYTGATLVGSGTLQVDGTTAASALTTVNSGALLQGSGTVGSVQVNSGGTFAPGAPAGTSMTIAGNLALQSGVAYLAQSGATSSSSALVSGSATLAGIVTVSTGAGSYVVKTSTILRAASLSGTFAGVSAPTGFDATLNYSSTDVTLNLTAALGRSLMLSQNHSALVSAHNGYFNNGGALPARFVAVSGLSGSNLTNALTQISGETPTATHQAGLTAATQFVGTMSDPTLAGRGGDVASMAYADDNEAMAYAGGKGAARDAFAMITKAKPVVPAFRPFWNVWASGFGGTQTTDGSVTSGSNTATSRIGGVAVGADYHLSAQTVAGFALAGGASSFSVAGSGSGRSDLFQLGGFVRHSIGAAYVTASAAYGWQDVTTDRTVNVGGTDQLRANFNTNSLSARLEAGDRYVAPWLGGIGLTPYAAVQVTYLDLPAYAETTLSGPTTFALSYAAKGITAPRSELGLRSDKSFFVNDAILTLRGRAAWAHDYNTDRSASATFQALPGASFVVGGASPAANAALTTASAELTFRNGITLGTTFEGEFSEVTRSYAGRGVVRYNW